MDLPGYGYAQASVSVKEKWGKMIESYLKTSNQLKCVFLLIDIRHKPSDNDKQMYDWVLSNGFVPIIIATKSDKLNRSQISKHLKMISDTLGVEKGATLIPFSSTKKVGKEDVYKVIEEYVFPSE